IRVQSLICTTYLYRDIQQLIEHGKIYIAMPPHKRIQKGRGKNTQVQYAWTDEELADDEKKMGRGYSMQRFKGLGEMNAEQLWATTMEHQSRMLIRDKIDDAALAERRVTTLMGDKVAARRKWIEENVKFRMGEDGSILESEDE